MGDGGFIVWGKGEYFLSRACAHLSLQQLLRIKNPVEIAANYACFNFFMLQLLLYVGTVMYRNGRQKKDFELHSLNFPHIFLSQNFSHANKERGEKDWEFLRSIACLKICAVSSIFGSSFHADILKVALLRNIMVSRKLLQNFVMAWQ